MKKYTITNRKHREHIWPLVFFIVLFSVGFFYLLQKNGAEFLMIPIIIFAVWLSFNTVPTVLLHANYLLSNKDDVLEYDSITKEIHFNHKGDEYSFNLNDIKVVYHYKSFALAKGNMQLLSWDSYNHMIIEFNDGTKIVLTSLLMGIVNSLPIPEEKIITKMNFFRWVNGKSVQLPKRMN